MTSSDAAPARPSEPLPPTSAQVLTREEAVASAREAVRQSRTRQAVARGTDPAPARVVRAARGEAAAPSPADASPPADPATPAASPTRRERVRLALRERLPLWIRSRCGVEPKALLALAVVLAAAVAFGVHHFWTGRPQAVRAPEAATAPVTPTKRAGADSASHGGGAGPGQEAPSSGVVGGKRVVVDVTGKVKKPGIYRLPTGSRVADALDAAGGVESGTDVSGLNRARRLVDGEQIVAGGKPAAQAGGAGAATGAGAGTGAGTTAAGGASGGRVSLSSATPEQLETLPGVGPVLAQHIVEYRNQHGGFTSVDQLQDVNGIGPSRLADIKPKVSP